jgi:serine phosphatase RsbU (regulator of sigma subunit)
MKFLAKIFILILSVCSLFLSCGKQDKETATQGFIDISSSSTKKINPVNLNGEWEFYWMKLLEPTDFIIENQNPSYIKVPGTWENKNFGSVKSTKYGYGTYRLKIRTNPDDSIFGIKLRQINSAYKIWINDKFIAEVGKVGKDKQQSAAKWFLLEKVFQSDRTEQEIIIQVSNFVYHDGGISDSIELTDEETLNKSIKREIGIDFLFLGIILIISLYHLVLFFLRRMVISSLYFAILCIFASAVVVISKNFEIVYFLWPDISLGLQIKLDNLFYQFSIFFLILFIYSLFERESNKLIIKVCLAFCIAFSLFTVFAPIEMSAMGITIANWFFIPIIAYLMIIAGKSIYGGIEGSLQSTLGIALLLLASANDLLLNNYIINTCTLLPFSFLIFMLIQVYIITSRFVKAISYSEQLTEEMDYLNDNLEHLVKERTAKIEQQKEELENQSESLKVANDEIVKINHILERQGGEMNKKNRALTDSLNYAKRLQGAVMPDDNYLKSVLPEHFIFFQPKDIVSGDFYWYGEVDSSWDFDDASRIQILVAADCTGHGVPGAFMTLLGHNFLNVTVNIQEVTDPEQIIYKLDQQVVETLKQNEPNSIKDGMDIAVLTFNQDKNLLSFSGAGIPLYYITDGELIEYKGSNFGIGGVLRKEKQFIPHKIEYKPGDSFYIFSDGFADQIGGKEGRKYYKKKFKDFLMEIKDHTMEEQRKLIEDELIQWKGDFKQIDDILIVGLRM